MRVNVVSSPQLAHGGWRAGPSSRSRGASRRGTWASPAAATAASPPPSFGPSSSPPSPYSGSLRSASRLKASSSLKCNYLYNTQDLLPQLHAYLHIDAYSSIDAYSLSDTCATRAFLLDSNENVLGIIFTITHYFENNSNDFLS